MMRCLDRFLISPYRDRGGNRGTIYEDIGCIPSVNPYGERGLLDRQSFSRHGRSSIELVFVDGLKPDRREQSGRSSGSK